MQKPQSDIFSRRLKALFGVLSYFDFGINAVSKRTSEFRRTEREKFSNRTHAVKMLFLIIIIIII